jgi:hypothetical protein
MLLNDILSNRNEVRDESQDANDAIDIEDALSQIDNNNNNSTSSVDGAVSSLSQTCGVTPFPTAGVLPEDADDSLLLKYMVAWTSLAAPLLKKFNRV